MDVTPPSTPICTTRDEDDPARQRDDATTPELPTRTATTTTRIPTDAEVAARPVSSITPPGTPRLLDPDARSVLPLPADAAGLALRARILATFAAGTWEVLGDMLAEARPLPLRTRLIAVWLPLTEALAGHAKLPDGTPTPITGRVHRQADVNLPTGGQPRSPRPASDTLPAQPLAHRVRSIDAERELSAQLRADIRLALARFEETHPELWLVPATPVDETATYLGALVLNLRGHPTRPWIWKVPPPGLAVAISVSATDARPTTGIIGHTTLAELCRQNGL